MPKISEQQFLTIIDEFVKLSEIIECSNCGKQTKLIGETRKFGNWVCPYCFTYFPYIETPNIKIEVPFIKLTDQLNNEPIKQSSQLFGDPVTVDFPMDMDTGFLVPSYTSGYEISRKRNLLLAQAIDFTRFGRIKAGVIWQYNLGYDDRTSDEYETLISFADSMGYHLPFNYTDPFRGSNHICYFDSDVSPAQPASFDGVSFSVKISE
jgi:hypothetical protein